MVAKPRENIHRCQTCSYTCSPATRLVPSSLHTANTSSCWHVLLGCAVCVNAGSHSPCHMQIHTEIHMLVKYAHAHAHMHARTHTHARASTHTCHDPCMCTASCLVHHSLLQVPVVECTYHTTHTAICRSRPWNKYKTSWGIYGRMTPLTAMTTVLCRECTVLYAHTGTC